MTEIPTDYRSRYRAHNDEVLFAAEALVRLDRKTIQFLKEKALANDGRKIRLCAHKDIQDPLHEMFIVHTNETYVRPHKHMRGESFHVIEGRADVVLFDEVGHIADVIHLGEYSSGLTFYYRLSDSLFHTVLVRSDVVVFHETKEGPFAPSETAFAPWAPDVDDGRRREFMEHLTQDVHNFLSCQEKVPHT